MLLFLRTPHPVLHPVQAALEQRPALQQPLVQHCSDMFIWKRVLTATVLLVPPGGARTAADAAAADGT